MSKGMAADYKNASSLQEKWMVSSLDQFKEVAKVRLENVKEKSFVCCELGVADGCNSRPQLEYLRETLDDGVVLEFYGNDVAESNWGGFNGDFSKTAMSMKNTFVFSIGRSFYEQLLPPNRADMIYSFTALHWGQRDIPFPTSHNRIGDMFSEANREEGLRSFESILQHTLVSLKPGGVAYFFLQGMEEFSFEEMQQYKETSPPLVVCLALAWQRVLELSEEELEKFCTLPIALRGLNDIVKLVEKHGAKVLMKNVRRDNFPKTDRSWSKNMSLAFTATTFPLLSSRAQERYQKTVEREEVRAAFEEELEKFRQATETEMGAYTMISIGFQKP
jgi:hypothetical protein